MIARILAIALLLAQGPTPDLEGLPVVVGEPSAAFVLPDDTLLDVAYRYGIGFDLLARLNPRVDVWLPAEGTRVMLPTQLIPPDVGSEGLIINLPEMRLYDFTAPSGLEVFAISIGDAIDPTPLGEFRVGRKRVDPVWWVPESIREERPELPRSVQPGSQNPLGDRWMTLGSTSYGIHGTNNRWSIGRMATHGCVRLFSASMRDLYTRVPKGTRVKIVYQPVKLGRKGREIYVEAHPDLYEQGRDLVGSTLVRLLILGAYHSVDRERLRKAIEEARGVPVPIGVVPEATS